MLETRIIAAAPQAEIVTGLPPAIDALARGNTGRLGFLCAAWYRAGGDVPARTLVVKRTDGTPLAAIPTIRFGPALAGVRKVPGAYWPFRAVPIAQDCDPLELAQALASRAAARGLGPAWRVGPARLDDLDTLRLAAARPAGTSWVIDCEALREAGWPRSSTAKRIARVERRIKTAGAIGWQIVRGSDWSEAVLADLAAIETASWIAARTDGSGAKFMLPRQRAAWQGVLADPVLAEMLCATILRVAGQPVAFVFDLDDGPVRYGIAGTYRTDFARYEVGKLANHRSLGDAVLAGQRVLDLGAGDSGYKRDMGAVAGYDLADLLFVRSGAAARLLARVWGPEAPANLDQRP